MGQKQYSNVKNDQQALSKRSVLWRGIRGRCPNCGEGKLFKSYLKQFELCPKCEEKIGHLQADDGPAWLTILVIGHIIAPFIAFFALNETLPYWVMMTMLCVLLIALVFYSCRAVKGFLLLHFG